MLLLNFDEFQLEKHLSKHIHKLVYITQF